MPEANDMPGAAVLVTGSGLEYRPVKPLIGAEVLASRESLLRGDHAEDIRTLLEDRGVLVFPQMHFSEAEQVAFTRTLGDYESDQPDGSATAISIDPDGGRSAQYTRSSVFWHFDGYFNKVPILASLLTCLVKSEIGGNTEFCNTYAAWDALPEERKARIEGLSAVHALAGAQISVEPEPSYETFSEWLRVPHSTLPLVWKHRSGRKSLVIGNTAVNVVGMDPLEGLELLVWLRDWATQERFSYSHAWTVGDAVLWDNTGTLHRVVPYPEDCGRAMRRTKLAGEEPFA